MRALAVLKKAVRLVLPVALTLGLLSVPAASFAVGATATKSRATNQEQSARDEATFARQKQQPLFITLMQNDVPLGAPLFSEAWSLLSLSLGILAIMLGVMQTVRLWQARNELDRHYKPVKPVNPATSDNYGKVIAAAATPTELKECFEQERAAWRRTALVMSMVFALPPLILFLILDNTSLPVVWINNHTILIAFVFLVELALFVFSIDE